MNINEHDKIEIKGCMKMKEEIEITPLQIANAINNLFLEKDDLFVKLERSKKEIERLNNIINEVQNIIFNNAFKFDKWVENENGKCILSQSNYAIKDLSRNKVREIWDLLNKG